jgi:phosphoadenosine phosphosulfate reductase
VTAVPSINPIGLDLDAINAQLRGASPDTIVRWALSLGQRAMVTTSMGINSAATLHSVISVDPQVPVVWIDTGYNLKDTYIAAERIIERLVPNLYVYSPCLTSERISARLGGIPTLDERDKHDWFTRTIKLEPFQRALEEHRPDVWITGIRREETKQRKRLDIVSLDARGIVKVAPFFERSEAELDDYIRVHQLPTCTHYFDPTKVESGRECGLHRAG